MDFGDDRESLWVATTSSTIRNWSLSPLQSQAQQSQHYNSAEERATPVSTTTSRNNNDMNQSLSSATSSSSASQGGGGGGSGSGNNNSSSSSRQQQQALNAQPSLAIKGTTSIKQYCILNDKRYIVTKDSDENVCVWDVLQAKNIDPLGKVNYENEIKLRQRYIYEITDECKCRTRL